MKNVSIGAIAALLASTAMASAGGIDRSGQSVGILFEEGTYVELSYGYVDPSVSGTGPYFTPGYDAPTGDLAPSYSLLAGGFKMDVSDKISAAVIFDQPFGSGADYPLVGSVYDGSTASLETAATTILVSYDVADRVVVYGGASMQSMVANAALPGGYSVDTESDSGVGYVVGAAYQIPEYALRVALTYRSAISTSHDTVEVAGGVEYDSVTEVTTPQSINLDFQTGINPKTLVFGSIRWANWSEFDLSPLMYGIGNSGDALVDYASDVVTYSIGVGRKLTDNLSGAVTVGYEASLGDAPSPLAPTDGYLSVGAGLTYTYNDLEITAGAKYIWLGDASDPFVGTFSDNSAMAFGLKFAYAL